MVVDENPKISIVIQEKLLASSRHNIAQGCSFISSISGFHPQTNCHSWQVWHTTSDDDVITGSFSWKLQSVPCNCRITQFFLFVNAAFETSLKKFLLSSLDLIVFGATADLMQVTRVVQ